MPNRALHLELSLGSILLCSLAPGGVAQTPGAARYARVTGPVKDAGVYHVATGTWSRGSRSTANFGPLTLFNNNVSTGFYGPQSQGQIWTATGRVPSTSGHRNATTDAYRVDGFQVAYCTHNPPGTFLMSAYIWSSLASCTQPGTPDYSFVLTGFPGCSTCPAMACWLVTVDLAGTSTAISAAPGDGDGVFDGIPSLDTFGVGFASSNTSSGPAGPFLIGDPNSFPYGDGTYYQNPGSSGTGLGIQDEFWIDDPTGAVTNGCYWFGGYVNGNPYSSFWLRIYGDAFDPDHPCQSVCQSNPSSAGSGALIDARDNHDGTFTLVAEPVPDEPGIFFHGPNPINIPFGNGFLCVGGGSVRLLPAVSGSGGSARRDVDVSGLTGRRYFQYWFRDPAGGGAFFNTSDATCCEFGG